MSIENVMTSIDVYAVSLKYIGQILLDCTLECCFRGVGIVLRHSTPDKVPSLDLCLRAVSGINLCAQSHQAEVILFHAMQSRFAATYRAPIASYWHACNCSMSSVPSPLHLAVRDLRGPALATRISLSS